MYAVVDGITTVNGIAAVMAAGGTAETGCEELFSVDQGCGKAMHRTYVPDLL